MERQPSVRKDLDMTITVKRYCGAVVRTDSENEFFAQVSAHASSVHDLKLSAEGCANTTELRPLSILINQKQQGKQPMAFVQIMEFEMESAEAVRLLEEYAEEGKGVSYARRAIIGHDRNRPGTIIQIIFFDSAEEAELNNELEITQRGGEEFAARALDIQFTDVDVITDITI